MRLQIKYENVAEKYPCVQKKPSDQLSINAFICSPQKETFFICNLSVSPFHILYLRSEHYCWTLKTIKEKLSIKQFIWSWYEYDLPATSFLEPQCSMFIISYQFYQWKAIIWIPINFLCCRAEALQKLILQGLPVTT